MPRSVDHRRRDELLDAAVDYAIDHGFADLTWRPVAAALGVSTTTLVHHFGAKEQMLAAILERLRRRIRDATGRLAGNEPDLPRAARAIWEWSADPRRRAMFGLFFAVYGRALQQPDLFAGFLESVVADWMTDLRRALPTGTDPAAADRTVTLAIATMRGLLLDLLATGDHDRVGAAAESFLEGLEGAR